MEFQALLPHGLLSFFPQARAALFPAPKLLEASATACLWRDRTHRSQLGGGEDRVGRPPTARSLPGHS
jgi:hypothetical protein